MMIFLSQVSLTVSALKFLIHPYAFYFWFFISCVHCQNGHVLQCVFWPFFSLDFVSVFFLTHTSFPHSQKIRVIDFISSKEMMRLRWFIHYLTGHSCCVFREQGVNLIIVIFAVANLRYLRINPGQWSLLGNLPFLLYFLKRLCRGPFCSLKILFWSLGIIFSIFDFGYNWKMPDSSEIFV